MQTLLPILKMNIVHPQINFLVDLKEWLQLVLKIALKKKNIFNLELIKNNSVSIDNLYIKGEEFQEKIDFYRDLILPVNIANLNCQYHQDVEITDEAIKLFNEMKLKIINIDLINSATPNEEESKFDIVKVISSLECENLKVTCKTTPLKDLLFTFESAIIKLVKISDESIKFLKWKLLSCSLKNSSNNTHWFRSIRVNSEDQSILFLHINKFSELKLQKFEIITNDKEISEVSSTFPQTLEFPDNYEMIIPLRYLSKSTINSCTEENMEFIEDNLEAFEAIFNLKNSGWLISSVSHLIKLESLFCQKLSRLECSLIDYNNITHFINNEIK